jgi:hypothetical protein
MDPSAPLGYPGGSSAPPRGPTPGPAGPPPGAAPPPSRSDGSSLPPGYAPAPGYDPRRGDGPPPGYAQPPAADERSRRRPRRDPGGLVAGLVIAGVGLFFLAGQLEPDIGRFVTLFIGLALLAVFVVTREYGFLIPGSLLTGVGIGIVIDAAASGEAESGVMMLAIAGGFLGIWVIGSLYRLPENHWWPLIPGGILTLIGLVQLGRSQVDTTLSLWPIVLIIVGALVLARAITRRD